MKKNLISFVSISLICSGLAGQSSVDQILGEIERNNTGLIALNKTTIAEKTANKTGKYLQNPEVEFSYLWGDPSVIGNRTDISIMQRVDFPSVYGYKNQIAVMKDQQAELDYRRQRLALLRKARLLCMDLIYANAKVAELSKRLDNAERLADAYGKKFSIGETNILELNRSKLNQLNLSKDLEEAEIERNNLMSELFTMNGGKEITFTQIIYSDPLIPAEFEQWYQQAEQASPYLNWLRQETELSRKEEQLNRALRLPRFQAGYMSEKVVGQQFQGISLGMSIPMWENKNTVSYARAKTEMLESVMEDHKLQIYNHLKSLHAKAISLQKSVADFRKELQTLDNSDLYRKALDKGEISIVDYILGLSIYYEGVDKLLHMERDLNKTFTELLYFM